MVSTRAGAPPAKLQGHDGRVNAVAFTPDGRTLVSASRRVNAIGMLNMELAAFRELRGEVLVWDVPTRTLRGMPDEYMDGMAARCDILGDNSIENNQKSWDPVWDAPKYGQAVHILVPQVAAGDHDGTDGLGGVALLRGADLVVAYDVSHIGIV